MYRVSYQERDAAKLERDMKVSLAKQAKLKGRPQCLKNPNKVSFYNNASEAS